MRTRSAKSVHDRLLQGFGVTLLVSILIIICPPRTVYAQAEHPVTVSFGAGVSPLVGRISNSLDNGWHITVNGGVNITRHFQAALEYGYNGYGVGQKLISEAKVPEGNSHLWWLTANPKLRFKPIHTVDPYVVGGVGYYRRTIEFTTPATVSVFIFDPIFGTLAPGMGDIPRTPGLEQLNGTAEKGYLHCGPNGAGHFVKMVHNGIEYGLMAAYAEGMGILRGANIGKQKGVVDAETTPLRDPEHYQFDLNLRDIAEVWRRGSVIASWLLDLTAASLVKDPALSDFAGRVSDSGEGRWTIKASIDEAVPAPVLSTALYARFTSRGEADYQDRLLSAMRFAFGGHLEKAAAQ